MYLNVDFIATSLVSVASGVASAVVLIGFAQALLVLGKRGSTHWLLRDSDLEGPNTPEVRSAQRHAGTMPTGWLSIRSS